MARTLLDDVADLRRGRLQPPPVLDGDEQPPPGPRPRRRADSFLPLWRERVRLREAGLVVDDRPSRTGA